MPNVKLPDAGSHYRHTYTKKLTAQEKREGKVSINMDPYRIADIYDIGGGPREHMIKKLLRGCEKGHSTDQLLVELRCCLDRWVEMNEELNN